MPFSFSCGGSGGDPPETAFCGFAGADDGAVEGSFTGGLEATTTALERRRLPACVRGRDTCAL